MESTSFASLHEFTEKKFLTYCVHNCHCQLIIVELFKFIYATFYFDVKQMLCSDSSLSFILCFVLYFTTITSSYLPPVDALDQSLTNDTAVVLAHLSLSGLSAYLSLNEIVIVGTVPSNYSLLSSRITVFDIRGNKISGYTHKPFTYIKIYI